MAGNDNVNGLDVLSQNSITGALEDLYASGFSDVFGIGWESSGKDRINLITRHYSVAVGMFRMANSATMAITTKQMDKR